jgi:hypothetical protein
MPEVRTIRVITNFDKPTGSVRLFFNQLMFWGFLVGAEGGSRMWFGGSWVIDVMVVTLVIMAAIAMSTKTLQIEAKMTTAEIRRWVAAGMPLDIKEWRRAEKERLVA